MLRILFSIVLLVSVSVPAFAQAYGSSAMPPTDHWATLEECVAATDAPYYFPSIKTKKPLGKDEVILPHPTGGCFEIRLPDRLTEGFPIKGRGWVRIEKNRDFVYSVKTRKAIRLAECDNESYGEKPFDTSVPTNPFDQQESVTVSALSPTRSVEDMVQDMVDDALLRRGLPSSEAWYSWDRKSGKVFWITTTVAAAAAIAWAVTDGFTMKQRQVVNVTVR